MSLNTAAICNSIEFSEFSIIRCKGIFLYFAAKIKIIFVKNESLDNFLTYFSNLSKDGLFVHTS